jgi:hypothetical protein
VSGSGQQPGAGPDDDRPWEQPGAFRRDAGPHRGRLLLLLGCLGACFGWLSWLLWPLAALSIPLGITACLAAGADLAMMRKGLMDPKGLGDTRMAWWAGIMAAVVPIPAPVFWAAVLFHNLRNP